MILEIPMAAARRPLQPVTRSTPHLMKKSFIFLTGLLLTASLQAADLDPSAMSEAEWKQYRFERLTVVRTDPGLEAESKALDAETKKQEQAVEAAMVKADPAVAPLLVKSAALLEGNWYAPDAKNALSWADWQTLRAARAAALAASSDLISAAQALKEKKKSFEAKVDAALVKADPGLAGLVEKLGKRSE
jgi:hypothetical protein